MRIAVLAAIALAVVGGLTWWLLHVPQPGNDSTLTAAGRSVPDTPNAQPTFEATIVNSSSATASSLEGMVYIPGGEFSMGSLNPLDMICGGDEPMNDARRFIACM